MAHDQVVDDYVRWQFDEYEILNVSQCKGVLAVYAIADDENPGKFKLDAVPIHLLAAARVTTRFMEKPKDAAKLTCGIEYESPEVRTEVVGIELLDGTFDVCNEASNFAGYCMEGEDVSQATGYLKFQDYPLSTN